MEAPIDKYVRYAMNTAKAAVAAGAIAATLYAGYSFGQKDNETPELLFKSETLVERLEDGTIHRKETLEEHLYIRPLKKPPKVKVPVHPREDAGPDEGVNDIELPVRHYI